MRRSQAVFQSTLPSQGATGRRSRAINWTAISIHAPLTGSDLPLDRIYDSRWENSTTTQKAITEAITAHVEHVEKDLDTIRAMESEFEDKGLAKYRATLELSDAITAMNQYQKQKEEILRRQAEEEQRKAALVHEEPVVPEVVPDVALEEEKAVRSATVPEGTVRYEVVADPFQIAQLEAAMREYGIKFRRV